MNKKADIERLFREHYQRMVCVAQSIIYDDLEDFRITVDIHRLTVPDAIRQMIGYFYKPEHTLDVSLQKSFLHDALTLQVQGSDLFYQRHDALMLSTSRMRFWQSQGYKPAAFKSPFAIASMLAKRNIKAREQVRKQSTDYRQ